MFSWATKSLESLSNTLAPPPTDAKARFLYCCSKDPPDERGAIACIPELGGAGVIVQAARGQVPLHIACERCLPDLIVALMDVAGASMDLRDAAGNTPLHAACQSSNSKNASPADVLDVVKLLVNTYDASVVARNAHGETPYDVALHSVVRQYLLPLQLQEETQQALDNGGVGLPPGIDLGGLKLSHSALPPPPVSAGSGAAMPPPLSAGSAATGPPPKTTPPGITPGQRTPSSAAMYAMAAVVSSSSPTKRTTATVATVVSSRTTEGNASPPPPSVPSIAAPAPVSMPMTSPATAPVIAAASFSSTHARSGYSASTTTTTTTMPAHPPSAPTSGSGNSGTREYALRGSSSAALLVPSSSRTNFIMPDGFHSSSSDKRLQEKYGHAPAPRSGGGSVPLVAPPPPSSGGLALPVSSSSSAQAMGVPAANSATAATVHNPFAGGLSALGGPGRSSNRRYVAIDPVTGKSLSPAVVAAVPAAPRSGDYFFPPPPPPAGAAPSFTMFVPGQPAATMNPATGQPQQQPQQQQEQYTMMQPPPQQQQPEIQPPNAYGVDAAMPHQQETSLSPMAGSMSNNSQNSSSTDISPRRRLPARSVSGTSARTIFSSPASTDENTHQFSPSLSLSVSEHPPVPEESATWQQQHSPPGEQSKFPPPSGDGGRAAVDIFGSNPSSNHQSAAVAENAATGPSTATNSSAPMSTSPLFHRKSSAESAASLFSSSTRSESDAAESAAMAAAPSRPARKSTAESAAEIFAAPPTAAAPADRTMKEFHSASPTKEHPSAAASMPQAKVLFGARASSGGSAVELFSLPTPDAVESELETSVPAVTVAEGTQIASSASTAAEPQTSTDDSTPLPGDDESMMQEVPLDLGEDETLAMQEVPLTPAVRGKTLSNETTSAVPTTSTNSTTSQGETKAVQAEASSGTANALFAAIGMPPPPFSLRK